MLTTRSETGASSYCARRSYDETSSGERAKLMSSWMKWAVLLNKNGRSRVASTGEARSILHAIIILTKAWRMIIDTDTHKQGKENIPLNERHDVRVDEKMMVLTHQRLHLPFDPLLQPRQLPRIRAQHVGR
jgi:hypothetical protein